MFNGKNRISAAIIGIVFILAIATDCYADRRNYVWTYEYQTMPKGRFEIEYYLTEEQKNIEKAKPNIWKNLFELEYGITDRWDVSMYQIFKQSNTDKSDKFEYDGFKIRTRYRISEKNKLPVDTLLYFEYIRPGDFKKPNKLEEKVILAKDIGKLNISYNQIFEQEFELRGKSEYGYAAGVSYAVAPNLRIGAETKGAYIDRKYALGPTISYTFKSIKAYCALGAAFGLNERTDDLQTRLIVGALF